MNAHLDELYFDWLYGQVCSVRAKNPARTYRSLLHILFTKEFVWFVPNDDNRIEDGKDLRYEFFDDLNIPPEDRDSLWLDLGCSMLELLVGLARRLEFEGGLSVREWFWHMLENLEIDQLNDRTDIPEDDLDDVLNRVIWRTYNYNGGGGLFPLVYPEQDQREVELWYQLNAYIIERSHM